MNKAWGRGAGYSPTGAWSCWLSLAGPWLGRSQRPRQPPLCCLGHAAPSAAPASTVQASRALLEGGLPVASGVEAEQLPRACAGRSRPEAGSE